MQTTGKNSQEIEKEETNHVVMNYDSDNYDYRMFWKGRDYEQWAEARVLGRLLDRVGHPEWLVDLGGGFGRNAIHYHQRVAHAVIIDYSLGNLEHAAASLPEKELASGHIFLLRADLYHLPFVDAAFDVGLMVRVLHHLAAVDDALVEIGRVLQRQWILDIPIKHHALACVRGLFHGEIRQLLNWEPKPLGTPDEPFVNFHLAAIRQILADHGWSSELAASANNFRRWDQILPTPAVTTLRPLIYGLETVAQTVGKGWWGPSQFVLATRREPITPEPDNAPQPAALEGTPWEILTMKMVCPSCHTSLQWSLETASCPACSRTYPRKGYIWDFVPN